MPLVQKNNNSNMGFKSVYALKEHNREGHYHARELFKAEYGEEPNKYEVKDYHRRKTKGHKEPIYTPIEKHVPSRAKSEEIEKERVLRGLASKIDVFIKNSINSNTSGILKIPTCILPGLKFLGDEITMKLPKGVKYDYFGRYHLSGDGTLFYHSFLTFKSPQGSSFLMLRASLSPEISAEFNYLNN